MSTQLYKEGDHMGVTTDALTEEQFSHEFCEALASALPKYEGDEEFQLFWWLPCYANIVSKYRGYKAEVIERRVLIAGECGAPGEPAASADWLRKGNGFDPAPRAGVLSPEGILARENHDVVGMAKEVKRQSDLRMAEAAKKTSA